MGGTSVDILHGASGNAVCFSRIQGSAEQQQDRSEYTNDATESCRDQSNNGRRTECTAAEECRCAQHV